MGIINNAVTTVKGWLGWGGDGKVTKEQRAQVMRRYEGSNALTFYEGNGPRPLKVEPGQPDDNVFVNYPEVIVEKGVSFLFGDELPISTGNKSIDDRLEELWPSEQRSEDLHDMGTDGGIFGDAWLKIFIDDDGRPQISVPDPQNMSADTDPANFRRVLTFRCQYQKDEKTLYKEETSRDGKRWVIREFESTDGGKNWLQIGEDKFWTYEFPPVYHTKNLPKSKSFYGKSDLTRNVLEISKYLSRVDSLVGKIVRAHSSPKPWAKGMEKQDLQIGTEKVLFLGKQADAHIGLLEMTGDLNGALSYRKLLREALAEVSKVPEVTTSKVENLGQLSGRALKILYGPLIEKTNTKRRLYGRAVKEVVFALLVAGGAAGLKKADVTLQWPDPIPTDPKEEAETSVTRLSVGFSKETEIKRLGGDPVKEKKQRETEAEEVGNAVMDAFNRGGAAGGNYNAGGNENDRAA